MSRLVDYDGRRNWLITLKDEYSTIRLSTIIDLRQFIAGNVIAKAETDRAVDSRHEADDIRINESLAALKEAYPNRYALSSLISTSEERWIPTGYMQST